MKMSAVFQKPSFDLGKYRTVLAEELSGAIAAGAFAWIGAATAQIPVWSGASHATFLHVARDIGFQLSISAKSNAPNRTALGQGSSSGGVDADASDGRVSFHYETHLKHLVYNEYNNANATPDPGLFAQLLTPGPYDFQTVATEAYLQATRGVSLPDPRRFIKIKVTKVG
mgnify:CR=1 FL=1